MCSTHSENGSRRVTDMVCQLMSSQYRVRGAELFQVEREMKLYLRRGMCLYIHFCGLIHLYRMKPALHPHTQ